MSNSVYNLIIFAIIFTIIISIVTIIVSNQCVKNNYKKESFTLGNNGTTFNIDSINVKDGIKSAANIEVGSNDNNKFTANTSITTDGDIMCNNVVATTNIEAERAIFSKMLYVKGGISYKNKNIDEYMFDLMYPIGSICMFTTNTKPKYGTWNIISDRFLIGDTKNGKRLKNEGGSTTHKLTIEELPPHNHGQKVTAHVNNGGTGVRLDWNGDGKGISEYDQGVNTYNTGGGKPFSIMPPYKYVFMWERTK